MKNILALLLLALVAACGKPAAPLPQSEIGNDFQKRIDQWLATHPGQTPPAQPKPDINPNSESL